MSMSMKVSYFNRKIPKFIRFLIGLIILNIFPITYLIIKDSDIAPLYISIIFFIMNVAALIAYFKVKEIELENTTGRIKIKRKL